LSRKIFFAVFIFLFPLYCFSTEINLSDASAELKAKLFFDPLTESGYFEKNGHTFSFQVNNPIVMLDYSKLQVTDCPQKNSCGEILVSKRFIQSCTDLFSTLPPETKFRVGAILIDPGHGGKDPGALASHTINGKKITVTEKDINLAVGLELNRLLKQNYPDKKIMMTRNTDKWLSLEDRTNIANGVKLQEHEAIVYISIHVNSAIDKKAKGFEVWYLSPGYRRNVLAKDKDLEKELAQILNSMMEEEFTTESILIANFVRDSLIAEIGTKTQDRGIKAEEWYVCRNSNMPSVLVEVGFLTNYEEAVLLTDKNYLSKLGLGIYNGLVDFINHFETGRGY
jgi:N-acetylmuramoyl-L-alanine amidase